MKVLLVHNFYRSSSPSGEDITFKNELELLKIKGIEVITYTKSNDYIGNKQNKLKTAFAAVWSTESYAELKTIIDKERPDIAHFHNIWYLISPSAYYACKERGIPVVQTCHNFRIFCASGLLMREGKICEKCLGKTPWRSIMHGCYRDSRLYTIPVALTEGLHKVRNTWNNMIDIYIALSEFEKMKLIKGGLPAEKICIKPHFLLNPPKPTASRDACIAFLGRLSQEKGILDLLNACIRLKNMNNDNIKFKIIGDGPLRARVESIIQKEELRSIELMGRKDRDEALSMVAGAQFVVIPSICYETFSLVAMEAFACGKPLIVSDIGSLPEIVENNKTGLIFRTGDINDLVEKIHRMIKNNADIQRMGENARKTFEEMYTAERNYQLLINIYKKAINKLR